jgi:hypothetical protein
VAEGKEYGIILDHAGNCKRLGLPDAIRGWGLDGKPDRVPTAIEEEEEPEEEAIEDKYTQTQFIPDLELLEVNTEAILKKERAILERIETEAPGWGRRYLEIVDRQRSRRWKKYSIVYPLKEQNAPLVVWQVAAEYLGYQPGWGWYRWQEQQREKSPPSPPPSPHRPITPTFKNTCIHHRNAPAIVKEGKPPHAAALRCGECDRFLRWLKRSELLSNEGVKV